MAQSALDTFVDVYLDEDLFDGYADEFAAASTFLAEQPRHAGTLASEIDGLLVELTEEQLAARLRDAGLGIDVGGLTYREWLTQIADHVRAATS